MKPDRLLPVDAKPTPAATTRLVGSNPARVGDSRAPQRQPSGSLPTLEPLPHYNGNQLKQATDAYLDLIKRGGQMFVAMGGAMSTAEIGHWLNPLIMRNKVHAVCCTGANLEEDAYNLLGYAHYERIDNPDTVTKADDATFLSDHKPRVRDTAIAEKKSMTLLEDAIRPRWTAAKRDQRLFYPHEPLFDVLRSGELATHYTADPSDSWLLAAIETGIPVYVPGWEDSTLGQVFTAECLLGEQDPRTLRNGCEYGMALAKWYRRTAAAHDIGFLQIGGGISGDFSICTVPMQSQDMKLKDTKLWAYFAQFTYSNPSFGDYSGASPSEKISWQKIDVNTPAFAVQSDATIALPYLFDAVLRG
jgi:deoxyhypusine synthase